MNVVDRVKIGLGLFAVSVRIVLLHSVFLLYAFALFVVCVIVYKIPAFFMLPSQVGMIILFYLMSLKKTFFTAFVIHQATNLPGGLRSSLMESIAQCIRHAPLLALWAIVEMGVLGIFFVISPLYFLMSLAVMIVWHTVSLPVIPLIIDNRRTFAQVLQQSWIVSKKLWIEASAGIVIVSTAHYTFHRWIMNNVLTKALSLSQLQLFSAFIILAGIITLSAIFKGVVYRFYDRERQLELSELRSPYF